MKKIGARMRGRKIVSRMKGKIGGENIGWIVLVFVILSIVVVVIGVTIGMRVRAREKKHPVKIIKHFQNEKEREMGFMFVKERLKDGEGGLFHFGGGGINKFWMKNTFIPLDMIFLNKDRKVVCVVENAKPGDLTSRGCDVESFWGIEVNGGWTRRKGLREGDFVEFV